ncbi:hypothetical protein RIF29_09288 [Crotalaria pallida]|uniref:Uncharacterized protein n=1 Tax=Crotalaria pallida TaxID=3830 RepID=A0AAN9FUJ3_CROPI
MPNSIPPSPNSSSSSFSSSSFHSLSHSSYSSLIFISTFFFFYSLSLLQTQVQSAAEEIAKFPFGTNCSHSKGVYVIHVCN